MNLRSGSSDTTGLHKTNSSDSPPSKKKCLTDEQVCSLFDVPLSSDEDFNLSSETDLGEGDSGDEDGPDDVIEQVSPLILDEKNENLDISPLPVNNLPYTSKNRGTARHTVATTNGFTWLDDSSNVDHIDFNELSGLKIPPNGDQPIDFLNLLLNDNFYDLVVRETNNYAAELFMNRSSDKSRINFWVDVDKNELKIFFGLLFHTGTIKMSRVDDYWKTSNLFNFGCFRNYMSRNRYMIIMRALHFCNNSETNSGNRSRIYKVEEILNYFNNRMNEIYEPTKNMSLDESMVLWRGRLVFRQYIKNKRHKYGVKLYMLTEPTGLVQKVLIYSGQGTDTSPEMSHTEYVVNKLMKNYLYKGRSLYMDNYYNSVHLAHKLLEKKHTALEHFEATENIILHQ